MLRSKINGFLVRGKGSEARSVIRAQLAKYPDDHWLMSKMAQAYQVDGKLTKALEWSRRARSLAPRCPIVLWDFAGISFLLNRRGSALKTLEALKRRSMRSLTTGPCGQSESWARALLADSRLMLSWIHAERGDKKAALREVKEYLHLRKGGSRSSYRLAEARQHLRSLVAG